MGYSVAVIGVVALCTLFLRGIPFLVFGERKEVPEWIRYLGRLLPAAIMAALVVYCLRGIHLLQGNHGIPELVSTAVVIFLHSWKKNILLTVFLGTICYMVLMQVVFA